MKRWMFINLIFATSVVLAAQEVKLGCQQLRITLDARLNLDAIEREWGSGNPRSDNPATLELVGCGGELLDRLTLDAPLAMLDAVPVRGAPNPTYLVSADLTAEAGSYSGPLTLPIQIIKNHLVAVVARSDNNYVEPIRLALTGKSAWRRISGRNGDELLYVSCQPKFDGFVTSYRRYFVSHRKWQVKVRIKDGLWESDGDFPSRNLFYKDLIK
jgi:hypothetical protein